MTFDQPPKNVYVLDVNKLEDHCSKIAINDDPQPKNTEVTTDVKLDMKEEGLVQLPWPKDSQQSALTSETTEFEAELTEKERKEQEKLEKKWRPSIEKWKWIFPADFVPIGREGGCRKRILKEGTGSKVRYGNIVKIHCVTHAIPSGQFIHNSRHLNEPISFYLGARSTIRVWEQGVSSMKPGEVAVFLCSPKYGYGQDGFGQRIPPNTALRCEIEFLSWIPREETILGKCEKANVIKDEGNNLVASGEYQQALDKYQEVIDFHHKETWDANSYEKTFTTASQVAAYCNMALCYLKLEEFNEAIRVCKLGFWHEKNHSKLVFRYACALHGKGDLEESLKQLKHALWLEPNDPVVLKELQKVVEKLNIANKKQKEIYGGFLLKATSKE